MKIQEASSIITHLKGSALSCLILMWLMRKNRRNWSIKQLSILTGWSRESTSNGLGKLALNGLALRLDHETWQLSEIGSQLSFESLAPGDFDPPPNGNANYLKTEIFDFDSSGFKESSHVLEHDSYIQPPLLNVEKNHFEIVRKDIFERISTHLILIGVPPDKAQEYTTKAFEVEPNWKRIELKILYWRCYCATQKSLKFAGVLIASRVSQGIDPPLDFTRGDIPDKLFDLKQEIDELERSLENESNQTTTEPGGESGREESPPL